MIVRTNNVAVPPHPSPTVPPSPLGKANKIVRNRKLLSFSMRLIFSNSRQRIHHIYEANISLRSNITCPVGQISLRIRFGYAVGPRFLRELFCCQRTKEKTLFYERTAYCTIFIFSLLFESFEGVETFSKVSTKNRPLKQNRRVWVSRV